MKSKQFGELCSTQINATSKVSKIKVDATDFVSFAAFCSVVNACDKRATKVKLNGEWFNFDELEVPACLKSMIYPAVLTPNGDIDSEADFLTHDFGCMIEFDGSEKPFDGYELTRFCSALYGSWKSEVETVKVSDLRVAASMTAEVIKLTCNGPIVAAAADRNFPISVKYTLTDEDITYEEVGIVLKKWIVKALTK